MHVNEQPFKSFINLINFDQEIRSLNEQITQLTADIAQLKEQTQLLDESLVITKRQENELKKEVDAQELYMKELDLKERERKKVLDVTTSPKECQSLTKEIETLKREQHEREEVLMVSWNKLETLRRELEMQQRTVNEKLDVIREQIMQKEDKITECTAKLAQLNQERSGKETGIPDEWLEKYGHMRMRIANPVVPAEQQSCSACFQAITNQELLNLKRRALIQCKGCYRLLFSPEAMESAE